MADKRLALRDQNTAACNAYAKIGMQPAYCIEPKGHHGEHRAAIRVLVRWSR